MELVLLPIVSMCGIVGDETDTSEVLPPSSLILDGTELFCVKTELVLG